eukprot:5023960-Prymnesium_polylepis.1
MPSHHAGCAVSMKSHMSLLLLVGLAGASAFQAAARPASRPLVPVARCGVGTMKETRIRTTKDGMPDVYDEASAQQLPNLVFLAGGFAVFIGGQAILGEEGTLAVARWLNEGPI